MTSKNSVQYVILAILDGWGIAPDSPGNAIALANTPNIDKLWASYPHTQLEASGRAVGLPRGEPGNTETGHLNLGAGRIVYQELERINMSVADGAFFENGALIGAFEHVKKNNSNIHFMGLVGAGGVHSNIEHLYALIQLAKRQDTKNVYLHLFTDGRDSPPTSAMTYINSIREAIKKEGLGTIATIMGRYWAMDRDQRWDRTAKAYYALTKGEGKYEKTPEDAINNSYALGKTDEFIEPTVITNEAGNPIVTIKENDSVIFFNFRIDRPRQLARAFVYKDLKGSTKEWGFDPYADIYEKTHLKKDKVEKTAFERGVNLKNLYFATMTEYEKPLVQEGAKVAFPPEIVKSSLGRILSDSGVKQLRISESEKERFVTFYFNGLQEIQFPDEDRIIIPSPKVPTYDQNPEMSAKEVTGQILSQFKATNKYSFILVNFANADMVGHTGNIGPAAKACEIVDECIGKIANYVIAYDGILLITADHGNVEEMINLKTGKIDTEHSTNPVPFIAVSKHLLGKPQTLRAGILADIATTVLSLLNIDISTRMTGRDLLSDIWKQ